MFKFLSKFMNCGFCGTDAPHGKEKKCAACDCPCDAHKEHTCAEKCESCEHEHKGGKCGRCGCA